MEAAEERHVVESVHMGAIERLTDVVTSCDWRVRYGNWQVTAAEGTYATRLQMQRG
jgi:hypothetical protein